MRDLKKTYDNGELTIIWQPDKCVHSRICFKGLPDVFNPNERPWVKPEEASTLQIIDQINKCPSGALSYEEKGQTKVIENKQTVIEALPNGPLIVYGTLKVKNVRGLEEIRNKTTAFCRCGASSNKPFCDGSHVKIQFNDE